MTTEREKDEEQDAPKADDGRDDAKPLVSADAQDEHPDPDAPEPSEGDDQ